MTINPTDEGDIRMHDSLKCHPDCECIYECEEEFSPRTKAIFWIWTMLIGALFWAGLFWWFMVSTAAAQEAPPQQVQCEPIDAVREKMKQQHAFEFGGGFINDHAILVLFATMRGEQWAAFIFQTDGNACYITGGDGFVAIDIPTGPRV